MLYLIKVVSDCKEATDICENFENNHNNKTEIKMKKRTPKEKNYIFQISIKIGGKENE